MAAADVEAACQSAFYSVPHDCKLFLKAVAVPPSPPAGAPTSLFNVQPFVGNADQIVHDLRLGNGWLDLNRDIDQAVAYAKAGYFVVAGMTSQDLGQNNGHVAVVLGVDKQASGLASSPLGYARSLADANLPVSQKGPNEAYADKLSRTFRAVIVQSGLVSYYSKAPDNYGVGPVV